MGTKTCLYKIILLISLIVTNPVLADDAPEPLHFIGRYDFDWSGISLGTLVLGIEEKDDSYSLRLLVFSGGIVNFFTRHVSDTIASGQRINGAYLPHYYESYYKTKNKPRHTRLEFDARGAIKKEINEPPEDRSDRPEVPHRLKDGAYDPLTGMMVLRQGLKKLRAFDAKRLYEINAQEGGKDALFIAGKWRRSTALILSRKPLAGLTPKETSEYNKGEPPLAFYFSNDEYRIPLAINLPLFIGSIHGVLARECKDWNECAIKVSPK